MCKLKSSRKFGISSRFLAIEIQNFDVLELCHTSQNNSQNNSRFSRFPSKSPDSPKNFVFLPKQALLELSRPVLSYSIKLIVVVVFVLLEIYRYCCHRNVAYSNSFVNCAPKLTLDKISEWELNHVHQTKCIYYFRVRFKLLVKGSKL